MLLELIIIACVALAAVGVVLLPLKLLRVKAHKGLAPAVAGIAMVVFTIWWRYDWAERTTAALPADARVLAAYPYEGPLEPWTMLWPRNDRLLVLDGGATLRNPEHPDLAIVKLELIEQNADTLEMRQFVDCAGRRLAPVTETGFAAGRPPEQDWQPATALPGLVEAVCAP